MTHSSCKTGVRLEFINQLSGCYNANYFFFCQRWVITPITQVKEVVSLFAMKIFIYHMLAELFSLIYLNGSSVSVLALC